MMEADLTEQIIGAAIEAHKRWGPGLYDLNFASRKFGADARRAGCSCIIIPHLSAVALAKAETPRNKADAPKSRDLRRTNHASLSMSFRVTRQVIEQPQ